MNNYLLLFSICCTSFLLSAQNTAIEKNFTSSLGTHTGLVLDLEGIDHKDALKYWNAYTKDDCKFKRNKKAKEYFAESAKIASISGSALNIYVKFEDLKESSRIYVKFDDANEKIFLNSEDSPKKMSNAKEYMFGYAVFAEKEKVNLMLKEAEKDYKVLEKEMKNLKKDKESYERAIEKAKNQIVENEQKIEQNILDQEVKEGAIENQSSLIESIKEQLLNIGKENTKL